MKKIILFVFLSLLAFLTACTTVGFHDLSEKKKNNYLDNRPKLMLSIVVDQMRSDYLMRFKDKLTPGIDTNGRLGGFQYLIENGAYYPLAEYSLLQNMTGPGHANILTGANAYLNGIALNTWQSPFQTDTDYCVRDTRYSIVTSSTETINSKGVSPQFLRATTLGDELKNASAPSKVVSVSLKDRSAVLLGGHRSDLSLWFDTKPFQWVTSTFYTEKLPEWVNVENSKIKTTINSETSFKKVSADSNLTPDREPAGKNLTYGKGLGLSFPHSVKIGKKDAIKLPYGLNITADAAIAAFDNEQLGRDKFSDMLAVSFSSFDYMGHAFGPNSREMEEMLVATDQAISKLLNHINSSIPGGLENVLIMLTADHGASPNPEWLAGNKIPAGRINSAKLIERAELKLTEKFGKPVNTNWIIYDNDFNFFLNQPLIKKMKLDRSSVETVTKEVLVDSNKFIQVFTRSEYFEGNLPVGMFRNLIENTYVDGRSGDVIAIPFPHNLHDDRKFVADHLTGYSYDRYVPLLISGSNIVANTYSEQAKIVDIAPTLSYLLGIVPPSMSEGRVLSEIMQ